MKTNYDSSEFDITRDVQWRQKNGDDKIDPAFVQVDGDEWWLGSLLSEHNNGKKLQGSTPGSTGKGKVAPLLN
jgi:hypothetical protein